MMKKFMYKINKKYLFFISVLLIFSISCSKESKVFSKSRKYYAIAENKNGFIFIKIYSTNENKLLFSKETEASIYHKYKLTWEKDDLIIKSSDLGVIKYLKNKSAWGLSEINYNNITKGAYTRGDNKYFEVTKYYRNGQRYTTEIYKNDKKHGKWTFFSKDGHIIKTIEYRNGVKVKLKKENNKHLNTQNNKAPNQQSKPHQDHP